MYIFNKLLLNLAWWWHLRMASIVTDLTTGHIPAFHLLYIIYCIPIIGLCITYVCWIRHLHSLCDRDKSSYWFVDNDENDDDDDDDDDDDLGWLPPVNRRHYLPEWDTVTPKPSLWASYSGRKVCRSPMRSLSVISSDQLTTLSSLAAASAALRNRQLQEISSDCAWECPTRLHWIVLLFMTSLPGSCLSRSVNVFSSTFSHSVSQNTQCVAGESS